MLEGDAALAEGTEVRVEPVSTSAPEATQDRSPLAETLLRFAGSVEGLPGDAARNLDHYLYGQPKR